MTLTKVQVAPGVQSDLTKYAAEKTWRDSNRIRFRDGRLEPIGGWTSLDQASAVLGIGRGGHVWSEIGGTKIIAFGTDRRLYLRRGGTVYNITPVRASGTLGNDPITTTNTSAVVSIAHTSHGVAVNTAVTFSGATATGGITIDGEYFVTAVTSANAYTITHSSAATSSVTGGGASVTYSYEINPGKTESTVGFGWGAGTWGASTWGTARTTGIVIELDLRTWSLDNWGEDLIASPRGGKIYQWDATNGVSVPAVVIGNAPDQVEKVIISPEDRHMIALGADGDPMAVKWCDQDDFTNWTSGVGSTSDLRRLLHGSKLTAGIRTKGEILIWSDNALYSMRYTGAGQYVFDIDRVGEKCPVFGINTAADMDGVAYWMGQGSFYLYNGRVVKMKSSVLRTVFDDIASDQNDKCFVWVNAEWNEVWYFYASASGGGEIDKYAKVNFTDGTWDIGLLDRTWVIPKDVWAYPIAADASNVMYEHENGTNADGSALGDYCETGEFDLGDGEEVMFNRRFIADFNLTGSNTVAVTMKTRNYTDEDTPQITKGPYTIAAGTAKTDARFRGRHAVMRVGSGSTEAKYRMGDMRFDIQPDGKR
jgi:hypothetical protein